MFQETNWRQGYKLSCLKCIYVLEAQTKDLDNFLSTLLLVEEQEGIREECKGHPGWKQSQHLACVPREHSTGQTNLSKWYCERAEILLYMQIRKTESFIVGSRQVSLGCPGKKHHFYTGQ